MGAKAGTDAAYAALAEEFGFDPEAASDDYIAQTTERYSKWELPLNPTQREAFNNKRGIYFLLYGERYSGKTIGGLHMLVDHAFNNLNAVCAVLVRVASMAKDGGAWDKLLVEVLPVWKEAIGLDYTESHMDPQTKRPFITIRNRFGFASRVICISIPVGAHVADLMKGPEFSFVLVDEAQTTNDADYFTHIVMQVGRKHHIAHQPVVYCCNPDGPSHWLYQRFFIEPVNKETQEWNQDYAVYHVPIAENAHNIPEDYYKRVVEACRRNRVLYLRMVEGQWVDMPTGRAMFGEVYSEAIHMIGDAAENRGLAPVPGWTIYVGYDLGPAHTSIHFMQLLNVAGTLKWTVFDELNYVDCYIRYHQVGKKLVARMDYWEQEMGTTFRWEHVGYEDAFNQVRGDGSFDAQEIERGAKEAGREIHLRSTPHGPDSVAARMNMMTETLASEQIVVSALCTHTKDMFMLLESQDQGKTYDPDIWLKPKRSRHLHVVDSLTAPMFRVRVGGMPGLGKAGLGIRVIHCGERN